MIRKLVTPDLIDEQSYHDPDVEGRSDLIACSESQISLDSNLILSPLRRDLMKPQ